MGCYTKADRARKQPFADPQLVMTKKHTHARTHAHAHKHTHMHTQTCTYTFPSWCEVWPETAISLNVPISPPAYSLIPDSLPINHREKDTHRKSETELERGKKKNDIKSKGEGRINQEWSTLETGKQDEGKPDVSLSTVHRGGVQIANYGWVQFEAVTSYWRKQQHRCHKKHHY